MTRNWPRLVSRKTSEDSVKKSFLFEPKTSLKDFSRQTQVFRAKRAEPCPNAKFIQKCFGIFISSSPKL